MHTPDKQLSPDNLQRTALQAGGMPHPAVFILLWIFLAIALQSLGAFALLCASAFITIIALARAAVRFYALLRRTRWILFSLLLIYGYVTPGAALWPAAGTYSPTHEGLLDGALQLCRLIAALAGLSIVLHQLGSQKLVGGIYALAYPLQLLGLSRERIAVRLALTLHYAETAMLETASGWRASITRMLEPAQGAHPEVELHAAPLSLRDLLLIAAGAALLARVLL
ncbi:MAG TPA: CbiQ family ECF transporter T component [Gallionellaceae bacterium]